MPYVLSALLSVLNAAAPLPRRAAVVAAEHCSDADLASQTRALRSALAQELGEAFVASEADIEQRAQRAVPPSPQALQLTLKATQGLFYNGALAKCLERLSPLVADIERLPPGREQAELLTEARVLESLALRALKRNEAADESLTRVLRTRPQHALSADEFSPMLRARFERLRAAVQNAQRVELQIRSRPSGAGVFLDGTKAGTTPLTILVPPGDYFLALESQGLAALPRTIHANAATTVSVDLGFEGALRNERVPCLASPPQDLLGHAFHLAGLLEVDDMILVSLGAAQAGQRWLTATVVDGTRGQRTREGGIPFDMAKGNPEAILDLGRFAATGAASPRVRNAALEIPAPRPTPTFREWRKPVAWGLTGLAAASVATGVVLHLQSAATWRVFDTQYAGPGGAPNLDGVDEAFSLRQRAESQRTWAIVGYATGAAALGTSLALWLWPLPKDGPQITLAPTSVALSMPLP
ncbi:MAG: PEGA domain-containing protein [Myxococcaceae bacterium]